MKREKITQPMMDRTPRIVPMPEMLYGKVYNACNEPCDMLAGPCACGAWHYGEHVERYYKEMQ